MFKTADGSNVSLSGETGDGSSSGGRPTLFDPRWKFEDLGIGGLDEQFRTIFRRAFISRIMPPEVCVSVLYIRYALRLTNRFFKLFLFF